MRKLLLLTNLPLCIVLTFLFASSYKQRGPTPSLPSSVCSENPAYAEAIVAQEWLAEHPPASQSYIYGGHAYLDSLYQNLLAEGIVQPVPPPCMITALRDTLIFPFLDHTTAPAGVLYTGQSAAIYGRNEAGTWWYVNASGVGYGWINAADIIVQPETEIDQVPVLAN